MKGVWVWRKSAHSHTHTHTHAHTHTRVGCGGKVLIRRFERWDTPPKERNRERERKRESENEREIYRETERERTVFALHCITPKACRSCSHTRKCTHLGPYIGTMPIVLLRP